MGRALRGAKRRLYRRLAGWGVGTGAALVLAGVALNLDSGFAFPDHVAYHSQLNYWGGLAMGAGYAALVVLAVRRGWLSGLQARLAAAGRMAFTNYISQSLLCTLVFYGHGLGLFGYAERWQQALIVLAVWVLQLWWSPLWLARFRQGPLEALWRRLTYGGAR